MLCGASGSCSLLAIRGCCFGFLPVNTSSSSLLWSGTSWSSVVLLVVRNKEIICSLRICDVFICGSNFIYCFSLVHCDAPKFSCSRSLIAAGLSTLGWCCLNLIYHVFSFNRFCCFSLVSFKFISSSTSVIWASSPTSQFYLICFLCKPSSVHV